MGFESGNDLYAQCNGVPSALLKCQGYIAGIADVITGENTINGFGACVPRDVVLGQLVDVAKRFLYLHPETRQRGASGLVAQALYEALPCK
jgi:hypothetical protein